MEQLNAGRSEMGGRGLCCEQGTVGLGLFLDSTPAGRPRSATAREKDLSGIRPD